MFYYLEHTSLPVAVITCAVMALAGFALGIVIRRRCGGEKRPLFSGILLAVAFLIFAMKYGPCVSSVSYAALTCALLALSLVDLQSRRIPNLLNLAILGIWLVSLACYALVGWNQIPAALFLGPFWSDTLTALALNGLIGALVLGGIALLSSLLFHLVARKQGLGGGDVKLLAASGLFLGPWLGIVALFFSCIFGLIFQFARKKKGGATPPSHEFAFGPAISVAVTVVLLLA